MPKYSYGKGLYLEYKIGDCLELMKDIPDKSVDFILTDPPYNIADGNKMTKKNGKIITNKNCWGEWDGENPCLDLLNKSMIQFDRLLKKTGSVVIFYNRSRITDVLDIGEKLGWKSINLFALIKKQPMPHIRKTGFRSGFELAAILSKNKDKKFNFLTQKEMTNYFHYNNTKHMTSHPTEKPTEIFNRFIRIFTNRGDVVFDPFLGSGTTLISARATRRIGIGHEKEKKI